MSYGDSIANSIALIDSIRRCPPTWKTGQRIIEGNM
jgi:hypothetical protein